MHLAHDVAAYRNNIQSPISHNPLKRMRKRWSDTYIVHILEFQSESNELLDRDDFACSWNIPVHRAVVATTFSRADAHSRDRRSHSLVALRMRALGRRIVETSHRLAVLTGS